MERKKEGFSEAAPIFTAPPEQMYERLPEKLTLVGLKDGLKASDITVSETQTPQKEPAESYIEYEVKTYISKETV